MTKRLFGFQVSRSWRRPGLKLNNRNTTRLWGGTDTRLGVTDRLALRGDRRGIANLEAFE